MAKYKAVSPVSNEDIRALPVKSLKTAVEYYQSMMDFVTISRDATTAILRRDNAKIGLVVNSDHQPQKAGSLAFEVDDLDTLHRELEDRGGKPGEFDIEDWGDKRFRTFFMREDENGYCYCFYCPMQGVTPKQVAD